MADHLIEADFTRWATAVVPETPDLGTWGFDARALPPLEKAAYHYQREVWKLAMQGKAV